MPRTFRNLTPAQDRAFGLIAFVEKLEKEQNIFVPFLHNAPNAPEQESDEEND